jgi:predicted MFS family arabinose efflux permease
MSNRDAYLYLLAAAIASFGLGVVAFYLNFVFRALGYDGIALGALVGAQAAGVVIGAIPAATIARGRPRRTVILTGGVIAGAGVTGIVAFDAFAPLALSCVLLGLGAVLASSSGAALIADATAAAARSSRFGQQIAIGTMASFFASALAGVLAEPVAATLGRTPSDVLVLRVLVAGGGLVAALSALPILFLRSAPVSGGALEPAHRTRLLARFLAVELTLGLGAGSFLPFLNLFFAERYGVSFAALGVMLGAIAVAGSLGALAHGRFVARRLGTIPSILVVVFGSLPFALVAAFTGDLFVALLALAIRAALMYGSTATWSALTLASFTPRERAGVNALAALAWSAGSSVSAVVSGAVRGALGPAGYSANLVTLVLCYIVAGSLIFAFFRHHEPQGDVGALQVTPANSVA